MPRYTVSVPYWPNARTLAPEIESRFRGRVVYATVFPCGSRGMPDWVIWFAAQVPTPIDTRPIMRAPLLMRNIPPSFDDSAPKKLHVTGLLRTTGRLDSLAFAVPVPETFGETARGFLHSLAQWVFMPAVLNGIPVDVDFFMEIPVRY